MIDEEARAYVWNSWLDGDCVTRIQRYAVDLSRRDVLHILEEGPPAGLKTDHRYVNSCRCFWISANWPEPNPASGERDPMVFVRMPRSVNSKVFQSAVRAIRRDFREAVPGGDLSIPVIEGIEGEVADRFLEKGMLGWSFDENAAVERIGRGWAVVCPQQQDETPLLRP